MADQFLGEIRMFAGNFPPYGWAYCDGAILPIAQYTALFSLMGTTYGGDGKSTFALPNLMGRAPMHAGQGPGLSQRYQGETAGSDTVALTKAQTGSHVHIMQSVASPTSTSPAGNALAPTSDGSPAYNVANQHVKMNESSVGPAGQGAPHNNLQPYLALSFIIALQGIYPSRS
jgi:microcystin-dependent protein